MRTDPKIRMTRNTSPNRAGTLAAAVLFCGFSAGPAWAVESAPQPSNLTPATAADLASADADVNLTPFGVTLPGDQSVKGVDIGPRGGSDGGGGGASLPSLHYFTPRNANFENEPDPASRDASTCDFISPDIAGATCYKYENQDGGRLSLTTEPAIGSTIGPAIDQAISQALTQDLASDVSHGLSDGIEPHLDQEIGPQDKFAIGVAYQKRVRDLELGLGLSTNLVTKLQDPSDVGPPETELQSWKLGLSAGYTGFTFSTSYFEDRVKNDDDRIHYSNLDSQETFDLGVKYDLGPWAFGVQYSHSQLDTLRIGPDLGDQEVDSYGIGGSYLMGKRLSLGAAIQFWKWDEFAGTDSDDDQKQDLLFLVGSRLKF